MAALAMAVSPGFVFYGRYSIHEVWLLLFTMLFIFGLLGLWKFGTPNYLWCTGMGVTGMILSKETYIIHIGCALLAVPALWLSTWRLAVFRRQPKENVNGINARWFIPFLVLVLIGGFFLHSPLNAHVPLIATVCIIVAVFLPANVIFALRRGNDLSDARPARQTWDYVDLGMVVAAGVALLVFFYSGTFFHLSGVKGLYQAYSAWFATGHEGHGHEKPWYYWLKIITPSLESGRADYFGYELPTLAGLLLCLFSLRLKNINLRYLAIYGVGTFMAYSIVHYKTPWCIISFIWPFLFVFGAAILLSPLRYQLQTYALSTVVLVASAGWAIGYWLWVNSNYVWVFAFIVGVAMLLLLLRNRQAVYAMAAALLCVSLGSTIWLNYFRCTTETEPYVYVQTYNDIYRLTDPLLNLANRNPLAYQLTGHIIRGSAYPLPWMLGDFTHIGYYERDNLPAKFDADFLLVQQDKIATVEEKLHDSYYTEPLTIRPYQDPSKAYFNAKIFKAFFPGRAPDFIGKATIGEQSTSQ